MAGTGLVNACMIALAIVLFGVQCWRSRFTMGFDGVQYLDDADLFLQGDWKAAANTYWSPGYVWIIAFFFKLFKPDAYWEFPLVHLVNFLGALFALGCFQFFLLSVLRRFKAAPAWAVISIGFAAFLYLSLDLTNLSMVTPDVFMHGFVYLIAGMLLQVPLERHGPLWFLTFGVLCGVGYLVKVPFFFYSLACFAMLFVLLGMRAKAAAPVALAILGFALIAGPYIAFLWHSKGRLTYGESGKYNVIWYMDGVPSYHWRGQPEGSGIPLHPTRQILTDPPAYEFAEPIKGTYPPWFDPTYWDQGAKAQYRPVPLARSIVRSLRYYEYLVHHRQLSIFCGAMILFLTIPDKGRFLRRLVPVWPVLVLALFPFAMFAFVHAEPRFFSSFFALLWICLYAALFESVPEPGGVRLIASVALVVTGVMLVEALIVGVPSPPLHTSPYAAKVEPSMHPHLDIARALSTAGIQPGDPVSIVNINYDDPDARLPYFWARLARVHIVSEAILDESNCGQAYKEKTCVDWSVLKDKLAATGAKAAVAPGIAGLAGLPGWQELGSTGVFAYKF